MVDKEFLYKKPKFIYAINLLYLKEVINEWGVCLMINSLNKRKEDCLKGIRKYLERISNYRKRPLLVLYYHSSAGSIEQIDIHPLDILLSKNIHNPKLPEMDVLIHTIGGEPNSAYRMAQIIRNFSERINFLVPYYAYSAGTMMCFSGDNILVGPHGVLSPIDIHIMPQSGKRMPLLNIDKYTEFVKMCQEMMNQNGLKSEIEIPLMLELVKEITPVRLGGFFRERTISDYYGRILLMDYMFKGDESRKGKVENIIRKLSSRCPSHEFDIDYHIAKGLGLKVEGMSRELSNLTQDFIDFLDESCRKDLICPFTEYEHEIEKGDWRRPFIDLFVPPLGVMK